MATPSTEKQPRTMLDRRQTYRIAMTQPVGIAIEQGLNLNDIAALKDVSESGCLLQGYRPVGPGERLKLVLDLPQPVCITEARIVWTNGAQCGLEFVRVSPVERARLWRFLWKHLGQASASDIAPLVAIAEEPHYSQTGLKPAP
ncbi:MAG: PilZ domain-containing protein [Nitrospira sp.]|jgi:c-di-GMP-binding flagellar brake protein YcgR|nr:PilZ domain-containing protein [Nitrospira sp.]